MRRSNAECGVRNAGQKTEEYAGMMGRIFCIGAVVLFIGLPAGAPRCAQAQVVPSKIPVTVTADKLDYDRTADVYVAAGHVRVDQEGVKLEADKVVLDNKTGEAVAEGTVYLQDQGQVVHADKMQINLNTRAGVITKGDIFIKKDNFHVKGDKIERQSETRYHIEHGEFTSCNDDEWLIKADEMSIDMDRYATGSGVTFDINRVPVLYTPYMLFPVRRQSGFLIPEPGHSSKDGFVANDAFFWAISDYKDMTIYSDYREKVGHGTGVEYRYENSRESSGQLFYKFWDQYHTSESRWNFQFQHQEEFADDLSARADINLVSDERYFSDLEKKIELRSKPYLDSNAFYVERWNNASLYLAGQYSIDLTRTNEKTVQKLPELRYTIYNETLAGPLHLSFDGSVANFTKQDEDGARRVDFNPQLSATFGGSGLSFTPKAGARATFYDRSADTAEPTERKFVYAGADVNARISRLYGVEADSGIGRIRHSIEPTLSYSYIPHIDQGTIPQFDALDSISAEDRISFALVNRVTAHYKESKESPALTSFDLMVLRLSQSYDLNAERGTSTATLRPRSDFLAELYVKSPKMITLTASESYNTYTHLMTSHSEGAVLAMSAASMNLAHQFVREPATEFLIGGTTFKLGSMWDLSAQWWRDMHAKTTTQEEYKLHYGSQCWGVGLSYTVRPGETQYLVMVDLKGLGGRGHGNQ